MARRMSKLLLILVVLALVIGLQTTSAIATEEAFDTENFKGLVLTTSVGADQVWVRLYKGYSTPTDANLLTPVYTETTADGGMAYYYEVTAGGKYKCVSRHPTNYSRYYIEKSIYISAEEATGKTVEDVTTGKRSTSGWDPSSRVYRYTDEVMAQIPSSPDLWPDYKDCFTTPAFGAGRNDHAITSQTEMMNFITKLDETSGNMYTFILGQSGGKALDIPLVVFTRADLSGAKTLEEAAALVRADSEKNGKVTVYYQAQIHGYETAAGEGALAMIQRLSGQYGEKLLDKLNICIIPRLSPYGAYKVQRNVYLASGDIDPNGDFMRLRTVETQLRQKALNLFEPEVAMDGHEFILSHESTSESRRDVLLAAHFLESQTAQFQEQSLNIANTVFAALDKNGLCYQWYDGIVNNVRGSVGSGNAAYRGILHFLMETQGSDSGRTNYERRVVGQVTVATAVLDYTYENAATVKAVVRAQKQAIVDEGKTYEASDQVVLEYGKERDASLAISGNKIDLASGKLTSTTFTADVWKIVLRARPAPTAYVIPAGESYTEHVLELMDMQGISYYEVPAGTCINLQQYRKVTLNDSGKIIEAALTDEQVVSFPQGAYVFSMAQVNANILSLLMEPDVTQNTTNTLVQAGTVPIGDDDMIPIYRYIRNLNAQGQIDYAAVSPAPEGLVAVGATKIGGTGKIIGLDAAKAYEYRTESEGSYTAVPAGATEITGLAVGKYYVRFAATQNTEASTDVLVEVVYGVLDEYAVYLDSTNGAAENDGYTETSAVNTIDLAYSQLTALMETAPAGTTGKIVIIGTYTQDGERILPSHSYPLLITGGKFIFKETSPAGDYRYLGMGGDTTFDNITISVGSASDSYYLYAQGHKFTIGENVVCEAYKGSSSSHYFSISGGKKGGGTVTNTDLTIKSGRFTTVYAADYTGKVTGLAKAVLSNCRVYRLTPSYIGNTKGDVYMEMRNVTVGKEVLCGHRTRNSVSGNVTLVLGENVTAPGIYAGSNSGGSVLGVVTIIADGIDLTANEIHGKALNTTGTIGGLRLIVNQGELADVADTFVTRDNVDIVLGCDQTKTVDLVYSCNLDLNGYDVDVNVSTGKILTVKDSKTDDYNISDNVYGKLTAIGAVKPFDGYLQVVEGDGMSFHKYKLEIATVSLRPNAAGIYFVGNYQIDQSMVKRQGITISLVNQQPVADGTDETCLWTAGNTSVLVANILSADKSAADNAHRGAMPIYARAYMELKDGTIVYSNAFGIDLLTVVQTIDTQWSSLTEKQQQAISTMYASFKETMDLWNIPNLKEQAAA